MIDTTCYISGETSEGLEIGGALVMTHVANWNASVSPGAVLLVLGFSAAVGVIFGVWPARRAASLDPVEALRYE